MFERLVRAAEAHWSKRSGDSQCCGPRVKEEDEGKVVEKKITFHRLGSKVQECEEGVDTFLAGRVHDGDVAHVLMADNYGSVVTGGEEGGTLNHHHHDSKMADDHYATTEPSSDSDDSLEDRLRRGRAGLVQALNQERRLLGRSNSSNIDEVLSKLVHLPLEAVHRGTQQNLRGSRTSTGLKRSLTAASSTSALRARGTWLDLAPTEATATVGESTAATDAMKKVDSDAYDDDTDSEDPDHIDRRYEKKQVREKIKKIQEKLAFDGDTLPEETDEEFQKRSQRSKHKKKKLTKHEQFIQAEVEAFQDVMNQRFMKLHGHQAEGPYEVHELSATVDHTEAVKQALSLYHRKCQATGKYYAFGQEQAGQDESGLDQDQQRRLQRYAADLGYHDPDRFWPTQLHMAASATGSNATLEDPSIRGITQTLTLAS
mmetsp:Transcript_36915/g.80996  ORF Transcript_36915/g.80996 Transcript_36915/m.80996 type:complete len:429 (+) Transcript_36915:223-1509(+)